MNNELRDLFIDVVRGSEELPEGVRENAALAKGIELSRFDESYLDFLDTQIRLSPRGLEWTEILKKRRTALQPYCGVELLWGRIPLNGWDYTIRILPAEGTIIHWEAHQYLDPNTG